MSENELLEKLSEVIRSGMEQYITDSECARLLGVRLSYIYANRAELVKDGAKIYMLPSAKNKRKKTYRWLKSSILNLAGGI